MPRRTVVVEDEDDAVPLSELLRTGEASRLRRRGAMRATAHRRDDEDDVTTASLHHKLKLDDVHLELSCGVRSSEWSLSLAGPSRPSPLPRAPTSRRPSGMDFVFSSTGCGAQVSVRAFPGSSAANHVYTSTEFASPNVAHLDAMYLEPEQRALAEFLTKEECGCRCEWDAIGCRICGNALGFLYRPCHPRHANVQPTYIFFPSAVTPSPDYTFPTITTHVEVDDMSIDSPTFSPRVTRYFRSDDDFWPSDSNHATWNVNPAYIPTPPRSPPPVATPLAFTALHGILLPTPVAAPVPEHASHHPTATLPADSHRESLSTAPPREPLVPDGAGPSYSNWYSYFRSITPPSHRERSPQRTGHNTVPEENTPPPRVAAHMERAPDRLGLTLGHRPESQEGSARSMEPPTLHRVARRPLASSTRRPTSFDWSSRGRHVGPDAATWTAQGPEERAPRMRPVRRITMPAPQPTPAFTLLDAAGERSYPPSARSSLDVRNTLSVGGAGAGENVEDVGNLWVRHGGESSFAMERGRTRDRDREVEVGADENDNEEKEEDERSVVRGGNDLPTRPTTDLELLEEQASLSWY
ncbi:hypothetical protein K439DRAFT_1628579 [Ramaria rubella]|nr:hypothetical protein K439DRAFT_1628579 [Ramaria rubella]